MKTLINKILLTGALALSLAGCENSRETTNSYIPKNDTKENIVKESKDKLNIFVCYSYEPWAFGNFDEECRNLTDSLKKYSKKEVNLEIKRFESQITSYEDTTRTIEKIKKQLDSLLTDFSKRNGEIDMAILGFHSQPKSSPIENMIIQKQITKDEFEIINALEKNSYKEGDYEYVKTCEYNMVYLTSKELEEIAEKNPLAKKLFSKNARTIYLGCSAGRGDSSIAETFAKAYNVETDAPTHLYTGELIWNKNKKRIELTSKNNFDYSSQDFATSYKDANNEIYIHFNGSNALLNKKLDCYISIDSLFSLPDIKNPLYFADSLSFDDLKLKKGLFSKGFVALEENKPASYFMDVKTFKPNFNDSK